MATRGSALRALTCGLLALAGCERTPPPAQPPAAELPPTPAPTAAASSALPPPLPPAAPSASAPAAPTPPPRLLVLGDSLTDPKSHGGGYLDVLRERCPGLTVVNLARGGYMMNQIRRRFEKEALPTAKEAGYTHLVVFGGVNDLYSDLTAGRTVEKIQADLRILFGHAETFGWKVIALTVAPWGGFRQYDNPKRRAATKRLNQWLLAEATAGHIAALPTGPLLICGNDEVLCADVGGPRDGLHFGAVGHRRIGEALWKMAFEGTPGCGGGGPAGG